MPSGLLLRDRGDVCKRVSRGDVLQWGADTPSSVRGGHVQHVSDADSVLDLPRRIPVQPGWFDRLPPRPRVSRGALLHCGDAESGGRALSSGDVQQRDGAGEHLAVPAVPCGDVLRRYGADRAERQLQQGLLLQRGLCGGERERVRRAYGVQRVELRGLRGRVSCGGVLSGGVSAADAVRGRAVLRDAGAVAGERAVRRRVLLWERRGLEREAGRELGGVGALSGGAVLSGGKHAAVVVSEGDVLWHGGQPERVRLSAVCCRVLLPVRWDEQRDRVLVQRRVLLSSGDV